MKYLYIPFFTLLLFACNKTHNKPSNNYCDIEDYNIYDCDTIVIQILDNPVMQERNKEIILRDGYIVYENLDSMPEFHGGETELLSFIDSNLKYPIIKGIKEDDRVILKFIVKEDGTVSDIQTIVNSLHKKRDMEAIRLIESMPKWIPGTHHNNIPRDAIFTLPLYFKLPKDNKQKKE